jgi:four helix bundle protein
MSDEHNIENPPTFEDGQDIRDRSFSFACGVVGFCQSLYDNGGVGRMLVPQLVSCTLSFATMLEEARGAESTRDFISKCSISLKECRESWTRLRVCEACRIGPPIEAREFVQEANELIAIVTAIVRNTRRNAAKKKAAERAKRRRRPARRGHEFQIPDS